MDFYVLNPEMDKQIAEIRRTIRLSMNGVVSEQMTGYGIIYKQNFGVSIPRLREIASRYSKNHDLAQRLWMLKIRETMIIAAMLEPEDEFTFENALKWMDDLTRIDLIEQVCMNLFCKLDFAGSLSLHLIASDDVWRQITGFILSARIYRRLAEKEIESVVSEAVHKSETDNLHLYKSIALSLSYISRRGLDTAVYIKNKLAPISNSNNIGRRYISHEVIEEMSVLYSIDNE